MKRILILTDKLKYSCGVTTYIYNLIKYSDPNKTEFVLIGVMGDRVTDFIELGISVYTYDSFEYYKRSIFRVFKNAFLICKISIKYKIDIIHSQNYYLANISRISQKIIQKKTVQTIHNKFPKGRLRQFYADKYIIVNKDLRTFAIKEFNIADNDIYEIECGLPIEKRIKEKSSEYLKIIVVSRLMKEKGVEVFIKAVSLLNDELKKKCSFYIAGEGDEEQKLRRLNLQLNSGIQFLGIVKDTNDLFNSAHVFVIPSYWEMEGFPITIVEAALSKNLIIASDFRGLDSYLNNNDGFIFQKKDSNPLLMVFYC